MHPELDGEQNQLRHALNSNTLTAINKIFLPTHTHTLHITKSEEKRLIIRIDIAGVFAQRDEPGDASTFVRMWTRMRMLRRPLPVQPDGYASFARDGPLHSFARYSNRHDALARYISWGS